MTIAPFFRSALACVALGVSLSASAQSSQPIKFLVGFPPGGAADQIARLVSTPLAAALGQPVVVENRAGANGNIAGDLVAKSPADGYTLLMGSGGMVSVNPHIYPRMPFDPAKDLRVDGQKRLDFSLKYAVSKQLELSVEAANLTNQLAGKLNITSNSPLAKLASKATAEYRVLASDATLIARCSESRRRQPLGDDQTSLGEAIRRERELRAPIVELP